MHPDRRLDRSYNERYVPRPGASSAHRQRQGCWYTKHNERAIGASSSVVKPVSSEKRASQSPTCCHISMILGTFSRAESTERACTKEGRPQRPMTLPGYTSLASEKCSGDKFIDHLSTYEPNKTDNVEESKKAKAA